MVFLTVVAPATAQTVTGTIQGTITDASGGVLPGVTVTIKNEQTGAAREAVSKPSALTSRRFWPSVGTP